MQVETFVGDLTRTSDPPDNHPLDNGRRCVEDGSGFLRRRGLARCVGAALGAALLLLPGCVSAMNAGVPLVAASANPAVHGLAVRARAGDKQAQFDLGMRFETGDGVEQSWTQAMKLYRTAAHDEPGTQWPYMPSPGGGAPAMVIPVKTGVPRQGLDAAKRRLDSWHSKRNTASLPTYLSFSQAQISQNSNFDEFTPCRHCPTFVRIPAHRNLSRKIIYVAKFELTWKEYIASVDEGACRMGHVSSPSDDFLDPKRDFDQECRDRDIYKIDWPATTLDLNEMKCYISWLQTKTPYRISIPTGDEWEVIARAGRDGVMFPWGNEPDETREALPGSQRKTPSNEEIRRLWELGLHPYGAKVGSYPPNSWGIYDLMGNAVELTSYSLLDKSQGFDLVYAPASRVASKSTKRVFIKGANFGDADWKTDGISRSQYTLIYKDRFVYDVALRLILLRVE